jgi:hypothetical protein
VARPRRRSRLGSDFGERRGNASKQMVVEASIGLGKEWSSLAGGGEGRTGNFTTAAAMADGRSGGARVGGQ